MSVEFSVVIPVYQDWSRVPELLQALSEQAFPAEQFEVLLVDNGSDTLPETCDWPEFVRLLHCPTPGSYAARNAGAAGASGRWLLFTDADCRPKRDWLAEMLARLSAEGEETIVAGGIDMLIEGEPTPAAHYDVAMGLPQKRYVSRGYGVTANLAVSRALFERLGGFEDARFSGGDAEFCRRAVSRGAGLVYCESARVVHPARCEMAELVRKVRRVKGGQLRNGPLSRRLAYAVRGLLPPIWAWRRIWRLEGYPAARRRQLAWVQARLWLAEIAEILRLMLGRTPERR